MGRGVKRPAAPAASDATAAAGELLAAVAALGGALDGIEPQVVEGMGLGFVATRDLSPGHAVLRLPASAVITTEVALASPVGAAIAAEFDVVADEHAGEAEAAAPSDWRAEWAEREAAWAREEAAEASAAAAKRGSKGARGRTAPESYEEEHSSDQSDSGEEVSDEDGDAQQRRSVGVRSVLYAYLIAARAASPALPAAHVAYARSLPASFDVPLLWPDAECAELAGTELARSVALMRDHLRDEYDALFPRMCAAAPALFRRPVFTWAAFMWAHAAYSSRCFAGSCAPGAAGAAEDAEGVGLVGDGAEQDAAAAHGVLLPLLDIANHKPEGADIRWDATAGVAVLKRAIKAGEQMYNCYGAKDTGTWLLHFGFAPWSNPAETVTLRLAATFPDDTSAASEAAAERTRGRKQRLFAQLAGGRLGALVCILRRGPLPPLLLAVARVCCMSAQEVAAAAGDASGALAGRVSTANEHAALTYVGELLARRIAGLLRGDSAAAWAQRVAAARAKDAVRCSGDGAAEIAVTRAGAAVAYRNGLLDVLQLAAHAVETALAAL